MHEGNGHTLGEAAGSSAVTITQQTMPQHLHFLQGVNKNGDQPIPTGNMLGNVNNLYRPASSLIALLAGTVTNVGGSQPHTNMCPYLVLNFCIALQGIFPSQN
jgi:microcystin-dependent protein